MLGIVGIPVLAYVLIAGALVAAGALLTRKKRREAPDDFSGSSATMGAYIPLVIGRARVSPVFLHLNDATTGSLIRERAIHALCVGPASILTAIYENGEEIWRGPVNPASHPSGSAVATLPNRGTFHVYWGFRDDPIIPNLTVASRMPLVMKILWNPRELGNSRNWPRLEYEVTCPCYSQIANTPSELPYQGDDNLPTFQSWVDSFSGGYVPTGRSASDRAVFDVWGYRAATRELIILDKQRFVTPTTASQDLRIENLYPDGGIIKVFTYNGSVVVFEGTSHNDPLSAILANGQWKYFWIARSYTSPTIIQRTESAATYFTHNAVYVTLGTEVLPELISNMLPSGTGPAVVSGPTPINIPVAGYAAPVEIEGTDGINPVHLIDQVLFAKFPYGVARDRELFDARSIEAAADKVHLEKIRGGVAFTDGEQAESALAPLLQDMGIMICWDVEVGNYVFRVIRYEETGTDLPRDVFLDVPELVTLNGDQPTDVIAFTYKDRNRNYREVPVKAIDSGQISEFEYQRAQKTAIEISQDRDSISRIVPRRQQEALTNVSLHDWKANHACQLAMPGSRFKATALEGAGLQFLVSEVRRSIDSSKIEISTVIDSYNPPALGGGGDDLLPGMEGLADSPALSAVKPLDDFILLETRDGLSFLGSPSEPTTSGCIVWASRDGNSFEAVGEGCLVVRGTLGEALAADTASVIEFPISFVADHDFDASLIEDLTLDPDAWRAGRQMAVIGNEVVFLRYGSSGSLEGLIRGRLGTAPTDQALGAPVYIFLKHRLPLLQSLLFAPGKTLHYKLQAVAQRKVGDVSLVGEKTYLVQGKPEAPPKVSALRLSTNNSRYTSSSDITARWCYQSNAAKTTGLGNQPFGIGLVGSASVEGYFLLRILNDSDVEVARLTTTSPEQVLTNTYRDGLLLDAMPHWTLEVTHVRGAFASPVASLTLVPS